MHNNSDGTFNLNIKNNVMYLPTHKIIIENNSYTFVDIPVCLLCEVQMTDGDDDYDCACIIIVTIINS